MLAREEAALQRRTELESARMARAEEMRIKREAKEARIAQQRQAKADEMVLSWILCIHTSLYVRM